MQDDRREITRTNPSGEDFQSGWIVDAPENLPGPGESFSVTGKVKALIRSAERNIVYAVVGTLDGEIYGIKRMPGLGSGTVTVNATIPIGATDKTLIWSWHPAVDEAAARNQNSRQVADGRHQSGETAISLGTVGDDINEPTKETDETPETSPEEPTKETNETPETSPEEPQYDLSSGKKENVSVGPNNYYLIDSIPELPNKIAVTTPEYDLVEPTEALDVLSKKVFNEVDKYGVDWDELRKMAIESKRNAQLYNWANKAGEMGVDVIRLWWSLRPKGKDPEPLSTVQHAASLVHNSIDWVLEEVEDPYKKAFQNMAASTMSCSNLEREIGELHSIGDFGDNAIDLTNHAIEYAKIRQVGSSPSKAAVDAAKKYDLTTKSGTAMATGTVFVPGELSSMAADYFQEVMDIRGRIGAIMHAYETIRLTMMDVLYNYQRKIERDELDPANAVVYHSIAESYYFIGAAAYKTIGELYENLSNIESMWLILDNTDEKAKKYKEGAKNRLDSSRLYRQSLGAGFDDAKKGYENSLNKVKYGNPTTLGHALNGGGIMKRRSVLAFLAGGTLVGGGVVSADHFFSLSIDGSQTNGQEAVSATQYEELAAEFRKSAPDESWELPSPTFDYEPFSVNVKDSEPMFNTLSATPIEDGNGDKISIEVADNVSIEETSSYVQAILGGADDELYKVLTDGSERRFSGGTTPGAASYLIWGGKVSDSSVVLVGRGVDIQQAKLAVDSFV